MQGRPKSATMIALAIRHFLAGTGDSTMARTKQASKRRRPMKVLPWGAAGLSLAMAGGASAGVAPTTKGASQHSAPPPVITLGEEELSDVSLSKFFVYDREATASSRLGVQYAQRCGGRCGGAGRCGGGCAARGCARCGGGCAVARCRCGGGCAVVRRCGCGVGVWGCAGCSCSCCISVWGPSYCRLC
jgi:hypothetical protein